MTAQITVAVMDVLVREGRGSGGEPSVELHLGAGVSAEDSDLLSLLKLCTVQPLEDGSVIARSKVGLHARVRGSHDGWVLTTIQDPGHLEALWVICQDHNGHLFRVVTVEELSAGTQPFDLARLVPGILCPTSLFAQEAAADAQLVSHLAALLAQLPPGSLDTQSN